MDKTMSKKLGISGSIAKLFLQSEITPLLALVGLLAGVFAVLVTPREEEPQINVTFANIFIPFPGASAREVEQLVSLPVEQVLMEIRGIEHVYSVSRPGLSILTVQYLVGENRTDAIVRLYNKIYSNQDWLPKGIGIGQPLIKPKGIDDVPIVSLTLWSENTLFNGYELQKIAHSLETQLKRIPGTRDIYTIGGPERAIKVVLDPIRLSAYGIDINDLRVALQAANISQNAGNIVQNNTETPVQAGIFLSHTEQVSELIISVKNGHPIYLRDVANVTYGPDEPDNYVWFGTGSAASDKGIKQQGIYPAVTLAIAKKPGSNAVEVAQDVIQFIEQLKGLYIPQDVQVTITRNYGETADDKAKTLIKKLTFATLIVISLVLLTLGWRAALVVGSAVIITLLITLFASWAWGFTLNRVSLFALIFSIGILVDDAIVVVENIHRHMHHAKRSLAEAIPLAVDEVGGPTILATFTVVAALLPMAFVSGLMGPYMSPIPINASMGMIISLAVAFILTPWLAYKVFKNKAAIAQPTENDHALSHGFIYRFFNTVIGSFLIGRYARLKRWLLLLSIFILIALSLLLAVNQSVIFKMLPFDNKSEIQVVVDMPEGTSLEQTARVLTEIGNQLQHTPDITDFQMYAGLSSPINFNGLVRQYFLREGAHVADIQINLVDKNHRSRKSHDIAQDLREPLQAIGRKYHANVKIVEVPPGPPVLSPLVAEIYGLDYAGQIRVAKEIRELFAATPGIVDIDDSVESDTSKWVLQLDRPKATLLGVNQSQVVQAITAALGGEDVGFVHDEGLKYSVPIRLKFANADKSNLNAILALNVRGHDKMVALSQILTITQASRETSIYHKDMLPVVFVTADMAGELDSPLYGMYALYEKLQQQKLDNVYGDTIEQFFIKQPQMPIDYSIKWDGEWQITYETFRDMGLAYAVGLVLIYLLVVAQFKSYVLPLIIMSPIPLTIIGVMPGHALLSIQFTATSMIGMIALAGIIVRNSILLVDFINHEHNNGCTLHEAVIRSSAVRAKPIALTALAAILGAFFILDDPIFSGLAVSLIFGILVSTLLTLLVIPVLYYAFKAK